MNFRKLYQRLKAETQRPVPAQFDGGKLAEILAALLVMMIAGDLLNELALAPFNDTMARTALAFLLGVWCFNFVSRLGYGRLLLVRVVITLVFFVGPVVRLAWVAWQ